MLKTKAMVCLVILSFFVSFSAQAAVDPTANWRTFKDKDSGLTLKYPRTVVLGTDQHNTNTVLSVNIYKFSELDHPLYDQAVISADQQALARGEFGQGRPGEPLEISKKVYALTKTQNAQEQITFSEYDPCDVQFAHQLIFFNKERVIVLTLFGPKTSLIASEPKFFGKCPIDSRLKTWQGQPLDFYQKILDKKANKKILDWYNTFYSIVKTIKIS